MTVDLTLLLEELSPSPARVRKVDSILASAGFDSASSTEMGVRSNLGRLAVVLADDFIIHTPNQCSERWLFRGSEQGTTRSGLKPGPIANI